MNERGKSDGPVVPAKRPNTAGQPAAEAVEGRGPAKGNAVGKTRSGRRAGHGAPSALDRVREVARRDRDARFTALLHHVDRDRLRAAYLALSPKAAAGVDGVTWEAYGQRLEGNLQDLHGRLHRGAFRARPSRRVEIPKAGGGRRPLGIAALEDKIVQRAVVEVLGAIYEQDFLGFSYGFRPGRSAHDALDALAVAITRRKVSWVLDADIRGFYDAIDHEWMLRFSSAELRTSGFCASSASGWAQASSSKGGGRRWRRAPRRGRRFRRSWRTSTSITPSTCGPINGDGGRRAAR
jgi:RNA-directed DNA polymerase